MNEDEKVDKFSSGLKPQVRLEVMKAGPNDLSTAAQIALNVDSAIFGAGLYMQYGEGSSSQRSHDGPQPMDIGAVESQSHYRGKAFRKGKGGKVAKQNKPQQERDRANNA